MGIAIREIVPTTPVKIDDLAGKTLAVDGYNILYQFLTTIRGPDGSPLTNSKGDVTSHLTGLFTRTCNLLSRNIKLVFVFDGKVPVLKHRELEKRKATKQEASARFQEAKEREDVAEMKKFAGRTSKLTREMVAQAKDLLDALGVPWIDAPSEGEAQASALVKQGKAWAVVSQDADALLYEAPRILKNLGITGRRKLPGRMAYVNVEPELIEHKKVLEALKLDLAQLRALAVLIGTDYNPGGIKGIGPKKGLKLVQEHDHDFDTVFQEVKWDENWDISWQEVLAVFENMPVLEPESIEFRNTDKDKVFELLVDRYEFSSERVENTIQKVLDAQRSQQKGLSDFF